MVLFNLQKKVEVFSSTLNKLTLLSADHFKVYLSQKENESDTNIFNIYFIIKAFDILRQLKRNYCKSFTHNSNEIFFPQTAYNQTRLTAQNLVMNPQKNS